MNISPYFSAQLRKRFNEDMTMRKLATKTQIAYIRGVNKLCDYLQRSPKTTTQEELREFQLFMVNQGVSGITVNATLTALKFLFQITLDKPEVVARVCPVTVARKLPVVLSLEEAKRFMFFATHPKFKAALAVAYGAGLRVSEVVSLKVSDIDSERMILRVEQGKGSRDRYALLSLVLLEHLRDWWCFANQQGQMFAGGWINYYGIANTYQASVDLDHWLRRRVRMCYWRQWRSSKTPGIQQALTNAYLAKAGLYSLRAGGSRFTTLIRMFN